MDIFTLKSTFMKKSLIDGFSKISHMIPTLGFYQSASIVEIAAIRASVHIRCSLSSFRFCWYQSYVFPSSRQQRMPQRPFCIT